MPGVKNVVRWENVVAVLATNTWAAKKGRDALKLEWEDAGKLEAERHPAIAHLGGEQRGQQSGVRRPNGLGRDAVRQDHHQDRQCRLPGIEQREENRHTDAEPDQPTHRQLARTHPVGRRQTSARKPKEKKIFIGGVVESRAQEE